MKYIEFGIGNRWLVRTETEFADGTETEQRGIVRPIHFQSLYIRIWVKKTCFIWDTRQGFQKVRKGRNEFKVILGIVSK
ncbi:hypothetical protein BAMA_02935 [Bacillus manliponensis]|uniref:DUF3977 domain-containing protein n=1 Tax=Bacillus manliponensis TaxID=574376 RepID=A0A073K8Y5_9BACI|nr:DUF3977 family protein [Bacillus manliponensis]KEK18748.1 hypothetical protein BAMA_02935 [Bacillus manliponensis]